MINILFHFLELWWLSSRTYQLKEPKNIAEKKKKKHTNVLIKSTQKLKFDIEKFVLSLKKDQKTHIHIREKKVNRQGFSLYMYVFLPSYDNGSGEKKKKRESRGHHVICREIKMQAISKKKQSSNHFCWFSFVSFGKHTQTQSDKRSKSHTP